jgi:MFS transporter, PPP family, 3-phenylpropionic acid transporter
VNALRLYLFAHYAGLGAVLPVLALGLGARGFRPSQYAWLLVLMPLSRLFAPPLWGLLADRYLGGRPLLRVNSLLSSLAMAVLYFARGEVLTIVAFAGWALVSSSLVPLVEASTYRLLGTRASGFGYVRVFGSIGFALIAFGLGTLGVDDALRVPFLIAAVGHLVAFLATLRFGQVVAPSRAPLLGVVRALARRPDVALLWFGAVLYYFAHGAFDSYFGPYARTIPNVDNATVSACWGTGVVAEVLIMWFVPRLLSSRLRPLLLIVASAVACLRWLLLSRAESVLELHLYAPLHGITFGVWYLAFVHENQAHAPANIRATVQGVAQACIGGGMVVSTLFGGYLFEQLGGRPLLRVAAFSALLAMLCYVLRVVLLRRSRLAMALHES